MIESHQIITNVQKLAIVMYRCHFLELIWYRYVHLGHRKCWYQFDADTLVYSYYSQGTTSNSNIILTLIANAFDSLFNKTETENCLFVGCLCCFNIIFLGFKWIPYSYVVIFEQQNLRKWLVWKHFEIANIFENQRKLTIYMKYDANFRTILYGFPNLCTCP